MRSRKVENFLRPRPKILMSHDHPNQYFETIGRKLGHYGSLGNSFLPLSILESHAAISLALSSKVTALTEVDLQGLGLVGVADCELILLTPLRILHR